MIRYLLACLALLFAVEITIPDAAAGPFQRLFGRRSCVSCRATAVKLQAPQYRVECNGGSCRRVRVN